MKSWTASITSSISIHAPREGSDIGKLVTDTTDFISIHAPREGSDRRPGAKLKNERNFNPRSP